MSRSEESGAVAPASIADIFRGNNAPVEQLPLSESVFLGRFTRQGQEDGTGQEDGDSEGRFGCLSNNKHYRGSWSDSEAIEEPTHDEVRGRSKRLAGGSAATIDALRQRLASVEAETVALKTRARRADEERAAEAANGEKARKRLAQVGASMCTDKHHTMGSTYAVVCIHRRQRAVTRAVSTLQSQRPIQHRDTWTGRLTVLSDSISRRASPTFISCTLPHRKRRLR